MFMLPLNRRRMLLTTGLVLSASRTGKAQASNSLQIEIVAMKTISQESEYYLGWPTIARSSEGTIYLAYSGGRRAHVCPFGRVELMTSHDDGASWTWPRVIHDGPIDDRDAGVCVTNRGSILVSTFTSLAYIPTFSKLKPEDTDFPAWQAVHQRLSDAQREQQLGCWLLRSEDGGVTFNAPNRVPLNSPHGPVQLTDGRLMYPGKALWEKPAIIGVCFSDDDGQGWSKPVELPVRAGDEAANYHELHGVEAANGDLVIQIRNHNPQNSHETLQSVSRDAGKTWSEPAAIGVWGLPSHLLRMRDGRLLMSYGYRRNPFGNLVRVSNDHGATWSEPLTISSDGVGGDLGYPSTVQLSDDRLLTVWYERLKGSPNADLRQAIWRFV